MKRKQSKDRDIIHLHFKKNFTYCGREKHAGNAIDITDDESEVTCMHCLKMMRNDS
jgi:hypothetical protein